MESNWGEMMPELAVRQSAHILSTGSCCTLSSALLPSAGVIWTCSPVSRRMADRQLLTTWLFRNVTEGQEHPHGSAGRFVVDTLPGISFSQTHTHKATCSVQPQPHTAKGYFPDSKDIGSSLLWLILQRFRGLKQKEPWNHEICLVWCGENI